MKKTFKNFVSENEYLAKLAKSVYKQIGADDDEEFFSLMSDVSNSPYGAAAGFNGFIYYTETSEFWRKNKAAIKESLKNLADDLGESTIQLVSDFNCFKKSDDFTEDDFGRALYGNFDEDLYYIYNALAWYALEEVASSASDFAYECDRYED